MWAPLVQWLFRPRKQLQARIDAIAAEKGLESAVTLHLRCMETLNGFCSTNVIARHAACARERLVASGATTLFVATMHARE